MKPTFDDRFNLADYFLFDRLNEGFGSTIAVRFGDRSWTYDDVADRTKKLAAWLMQHGVRPGERVLIILPDTPPFVWSIFATLRIGAVLTMGNPAARGAGCCSGPALGRVIAGKSTLPVAAGRREAGGRIPS